MINGAQAKQFQIFKTNLAHDMLTPDHVTCPFGLRIRTVIQLVFFSFSFVRAILRCICSRTCDKLRKRGLGIQVVWARTSSRSPTHFKPFNSKMGGGSCDLPTEVQNGVVYWSIHRKKLGQEQLTLQTTYSSNSYQFPWKD